MQTTEPVTRPNLDPEANPLLRPTDVAEVLGVSLSSVYKLTRNGVLPTVTVGGRKSTRIRTADLRAFLGLAPVTAGL
jgi:excisionase family DNA binding protein